MSTERTILVTGATGYIGRNLCRRLAMQWGENVRVIGVARGDGANIAPGAANFSFQKLDVCDLDAVRRIFKDAQPDAVVHCAGVSGLGGAPSHYAPNLVGSRNVGIACDEASVRRLVNIGSPSMYFDFSNDLQRDEDHIPARFANAYAASKAYSEHELLNKEWQTSTVISLRPRFVSGYGDDAILGRFVRLHQAGEFAQIGNGRNVVDFTCIENIEDAILLAIDASDELHGNAYNITNGKPVVLRDFLADIFEQVGLAPVTKKVPYPVAYIGGWIVETWARLSGKEPKISRLGVAIAAKSMTMSIQRAQDDLGYRPAKNNQHLQQQFCAWWLQNK